MRENHIKKERRKILKDPKRILQVVSIMDMGGIESLLMNLYRNIDRGKIQFDFLVHQEKKGIYEDEIEKLGGKIFRVPFVTKVGHLRYMKALNSFFKENQYKIIHSHYNTLSGLILREAKKAGIKQRIAHSHTAYPKYGILENFYKGYSKSKIKKNSTANFACSKEAGQWLFKKDNFQTFNNGIDSPKFIFNNDLRGYMREKVDIKKEEFAIINVASFSKHKNHKFMIEIMKEVAKIDSDISLYLIGDGRLKGEIETDIKRDKMTNVKCLGIRRDVNEIINAMDMKLFPSLYEGLGIVALEAQANGIPCLLSDTIPKEVNIGAGLVEFMNLNKTAREWAEKIIEIKEKASMEEREKNKFYYQEKILNANYDIQGITKELEKYYLGI